MFWTAVVSALQKNKTGTLKDNYIPVGLIII